MDERLVAIAADGRETGWMSDSAQREYLRTQPPPERYWGFLREMRMWALVDRRAASRERNCVRSQRVVARPRERRASHNTRRATTARDDGPAEPPAHPRHVGAGS